MPLAVPYLRVSTAEQAETMSLSTQLQVIERWAEAEGFDLAPPFTDSGRSAKTADRAELHRLLDYCRERQGDVACVVVFRLDRWIRELRDYVHLGDELQQLGVDLRSATEHFGDDETGELSRGLAALFAQYDNRVRARRTREGMRAALERGRWCWQPPLGYLPGDRSGASMVVDRDRAPLICRGFGLVSTGSSESAARERVLSLGLTSRLNGRPVSRQTWNRVFRNPVYRGRLVMAKWDLDVEGDWEPLVDDRTWLRTQDVLDGRSIHPTRHRTEHPDFPLRRFATCAECDTGLTGSWSTGRSSRYPYYRCYRCRAVSSRAEKLHGRFADALNRMSPSAEMMDHLRGAIESRWKTRHREQIEAAERAERQLRSLQSRRQRLIDAYLDEKIPESDYLARLSDADRQIRQAERLADGQSWNPMDDLDELFEFASQVVHTAGDSWSSLGPGTRRRFQRWAFPSGVPVNPDGTLGTAVTCSLFSNIDGELRTLGRVVPPTGFEPVSSP